MQIPGRSLPFLTLRCGPCVNSLIHEYDIHVHVMHTIDVSSEISQGAKLKKCVIKGDNLCVTGPYETMSRFHP